MKSGPNVATRGVDEAENTPARTSTSERSLDTAAKFFWSKGYAATSTREIAELLGVRKASLYHHINNKEDFLFKVFVSSLEHITRHVTAVVMLIDDPVELLTHAHPGSRCVDDRTDQDKHSVMLTELRAPARLAQIVAMREEYERLVAGLLEGACLAGALRSDVPIKYLSLS